MPAAWTVGPLVIRTDLAVAVFSLIGGWLFFRLLSPYDRQRTRQLSEDLTHLFMIFAVLLWVAKIMIRLPLFLAHPKAVLVYPADKSAFYVATWLLLIYAAGYVIKTKRPFSELLRAGLMLLIPAHFLFEFVLFASETGTGHFIYLLLDAVFIILLIFGSFIGTRRAAVSALALGWALAMGITAMFHTGPFFLFYINGGYWFILFAVGLVCFIKWTKR